MLFGQLYVPLVNMCAQAYNHTAVPCLQGLVLHVVLIGHKAASADLAYP